MRALAKPSRMLPAPTVGQLLLAGLLTLVPLAGARAQEEPPAQPGEIVRDRKLPVLNGHRFLTSAVVPDPFVTTYLRSATGFGLLLDARLPFLDFEGDTLAVLEGNIGIAVIGFEYQQALTKWLSVRAGIGGAVRTGTNGESLVAEGLNALYTFGFGITAGLFQSRTFVLSAVGDFGKNSLFAMDPFGFLEGVLERCQDIPLEDCDPEPEDGNDLLRSGGTSSLSGGLRAAYSPAAWFGVRGRAEVGFGDPFDEEDDRQTLADFGVATSFDLDPVTDVPIGFLLSGNFERFGGRGSDVADAASQLGFGVFYTGRREFSVGVDAVYGKVKLSGSEQEVNSVSFQFRLRYFF